MTRPTDGPGHWLSEISQGPARGVVPPLYSSRPRDHCADRWQDCCRMTIALAAFSDQAELLDHSDGIVKFLPRQRIAPGRSRDENVRQVGEIIAACLRLHSLRQVARESHELIVSIFAKYSQSV